MKYGQCTFKYKIRLTTKIIKYKIITKRSTKLYKAFLIVCGWCLRMGNNWEILLKREQPKWANAFLKHGLDINLERGKIVDWNKELEWNVTLEGKEP